MRNIAFSGTNNQQIEQLLARLQAFFPPAWSLRLLGQRVKVGNHRVDTRLEILAPDGTRRLIDIDADAKPSERAITQLQRRQASGGIPLLFAPYLSPYLRDRLRQAGISYADATGNLRLVLPSPPVYLETRGAESNPQPERRPLRSLKGPAAGRVVRALCDFKPPYKFRDLGARAGLALGSLSRVVDVLAQEDLVERGPRGAIIEVRWRPLLERWIQDYHVLRSNRVRTYLAPRGLPSFLQALRDADRRYCLTGSFVASRRAPVAPARLALVYLEQHLGAEGAFHLIPAEAGANVMLLEAFDSVVFDRTWQEDGLVYAALSQAAADLMTSPGRGPVEAEALMDWMDANEDAWRR